MNEIQTHLRLSYKLFAFRIIFGYSNRQKSRELLVLVLGIQEHPQLDQDRSKKLLTYHTLVQKQGEKMNEIQTRLRVSYKLVSFRVIFGTPIDKV